MKVLIADASVSFRSILANSLKDLTGAEIVGLTGECNETIHAIGELQPDVLILNIELKDGTGIDVLKSIRKRRNVSPVTILLSNYLYNPYQQLQLSHGAEYFIHKASQFGEIISVVRGLVAAQHRNNNGWLGAGNGDVLQLTLQQ